MWKSCQDALLVFQLVCSTFGFMTNTFLSIVILRANSEFLGKYKYLLFLYTASSALIGSAHVTTASTFVVSEHTWIFYDKLNILPYSISAFFVMQYAVVFLQLVLVLTVSFVYRYLSVCQPSKLAFCKRNTWFGVFGVCLGILSYHTWILLYVALPSVDCEQNHGEDFKRSTGKELNSAFYLCIPLTENGEIFPKGILVAVDYLMIVSLSGVVIIFCALRIAHTLQTTFETSESTRRWQWRIFTMLLLQLIIPLVFSYSQASLVVIFTIFAWRAEGMEFWVGTMFAFSPVLEPVVIFLFIKKYRDKARELLCMKRVHPVQLTSFVGASDVNQNTL